MIYLPLCRRQTASHSHHQSTLSMSGSPTTKKMKCCLEIKKSVLGKHSVQFSYWIYVSRSLIIKIMTGALMRRNCKKAFKFSASQKTVGASVMPVLISFCRLLYIQLQQGKSISKIVHLHPHNLYGSADLTLSLALSQIPTCSCVITDAGLHQASQRCRLLFHLTAKHDSAAISKLSAAKLCWHATDVENTPPVTVFFVPSANIAYFR